MAQMFVVAGGDSDMSNNKTQKGLKVRNSGKIFFLFTKSQMTTLQMYVSEGESDRQQNFLNT